jgi:hypothetical protein
MDRVMPGYHSAVKANAQVLIITHASKNVSEQGIKDPLLYPGAPHTHLLEKVLDNIEQCAGLADVVIAFDHKMDCAISRAYFENLQEFCDRRKARLVLSPSSLLMLNQFTATAAFKRGVDAVDGEYVLFFEHDHLFRSGLDWQLIDHVINLGAQMVRFNRRANDSDPRGVEVVTPCASLEGVCETNYYCNGPFLAKTNFCSDLFELAERQIPTWNGLFGGFVEGPLTRQMIADEFNLSHSEFRRKYPIYLYGDVGAPPLIEHFGDFPGRRGRWAKRIKRWLRQADPTG